MRQSDKVKNKEQLPKHINATSWHRLQERVSLALSCLQGLPVKLFLRLCSIHKRLSEFASAMVCGLANGKFYGYTANQIDTCTKQEIKRKRHHCHSLACKNGGDTVCYGLDSVLFRYAIKASFSEFIW